jgi:hypothetical protein
LSLSLGVERLESRQLLTLYQGPTRSRAVFSGSAFYQVSVTGGGFEQLSQIGSGLHRIIGIDLYGTTAQSQLNIAFKSALPGFGRANTALQIGRISVHSGLLGGINAAGAANLLGNVSTLNNAVQTISFNALGPNATINVTGSVNTFQVGAANLSSNGQVSIAGGVTGQFSAGSVVLNGGKVILGGNVAGGLNLGGLAISQGGQFTVGNDLDGASTLGPVDINGGKFLVGHNINGTLTTDNLLIQNTGQLVVGNDATGSSSTTVSAASGSSSTSGTTSNTSSATTSTTNFVAQPGSANAIHVAGTANITTNGVLQVGDDLGGLAVDKALSLDSSGKLVVGTDVTGPINALAGVSIAHNALLQVGRDIDGATTINGNLSLDSGGSVFVGRNVSTLTINGGVLFTPSAGTITLKGNVAGLTINGIYQGRGNTNTLSPELIVGLNLNDPSVLGGAAGQGSIVNANIQVGKSILGFDVAHGIFNSLITAGVLIDGAPENSSANGNIGPDGTTAVFDSQILAGSEINHFEIVGDVKSDWVTNPNPTGFPTRIVAGETAQGDFSNGGMIDNFQITGNLIDSVLAASVQPFGGDGSLPPTGYAGPRVPAPQPSAGAPSNYNAPAGTVTGGTFTAPVVYANFGYVSYFNETPTGTAYNTAIDPNVHVNILQGSINPSFASAPLPTSVTTTTTSGTAAGVGGGATSSATTTTTTSFIAIPTKSTVLGSVITTSHGANPDGSDFAGIFAADARGVFVGVLPTQS